MYRNDYARHLVEYLKKTDDIPLELHLEVEGKMYSVRVESIAARLASRTDGIPKPPGKTCTTCGGRGTI